MQNGHENVKGGSSRWINERMGRRGTFWQEGYGAFSIGESGVSGLKQYIARQKEHHQRMTFKEEFLKFLKKYNVEYDERYIWK